MKIEKPTFQPFKYAIGIVVTMLFLSITTYGQASQNKALDPATSVNFIIKSFEGSLINHNTVYFKFLIVENQERTDYLLEYSPDGEVYYPIEKKEGFLSPQNLPLLYCFKVNIATLGSSFYRIKRTSFDGNVNYSNAIYFNYHKNAEFSASH